MTVNRQQSGEPQSPDATGENAVTTAARSDEDLDLVSRVRLGERDLFHQLVTRYERAVYRVALAITKNAANAEDVTQETFLRAYQHLDQFRGESKFSTWLTQIALNTARMRLRKEHASLWESLDEPQLTEEGQIPRDVAEWRENPEQQYRREELGDILLQAIRGLHPIYRSVLMLRDVENLSTQETADRLGLSVANVKTRLLRARLQLRERLAPYFEKERQA
jgi:RNA polymerase sigma-70 factor (ECF subfamily)